jgi:DNA-directed RNA polymerase subunit K
MWEGRLTRFETARVVGARALQIALGAPYFVRTASMDPIEVSKREYELGKVPIIVVREKGDGTQERISL